MGASIAELIVKYHVFADHYDEWYDNYADAMRDYSSWVNKDVSARLYENVYDEAAYEDGEPLEETCLESYGGYPQ